MEIVYKFFIIFLAIIFLRKTSSEFCPDTCKCDVYENHNRAVCSGWNLINTIEISRNVEIFDLSYNSITILDNKCFENLKHLINLTISHNSIHTIYLDAFHNLIKLEYLDLSNNRLEYIDNRILEGNKKLLELNLSGNKFMSLLNAPLISSNSLRIFNLRNSQITHIYPKLFEWLPNLRQLDLSKNLMITLNLSPFNKLRHLEWLNLEENRWICDKNIVNVVTMLRRRLVQVEMKRICATEIDSEKDLLATTSRMFERMMEMPKTEISVTTIPTTERVRTNIEMIWKNLNTVDDDSCFYEDPLKICKMYSDLLENHKKLIVNYQNLTNECFTTKPITSSSRRYFHLIGDLEVAFLIGMSAGAAIVFILVACTFCTTKCCKRRNSNKDSDDNDCVLSDEFQYIVPASPPLRTPRRSRRTAINRQQSCPVNSNRTSSTPVQQTDFATFLTRLFERPSRHRYYRTINQNTAHMIRRLSRSNLFNNRLSRHFSQESRNESNQTHEEQNVMLPPEQELAVAPQESEISRRPETPPPSYKDVALVRY